MDNEVTIENIDLDVEFIENEDEIISENEVTAALLHNSAVSWVKFILTDDMPDGNKHRVPVEEFPNIIRTGIFMPFKMVENTVSGGHPNSKALGVITHLKEDINKAGRPIIKAIAAIWNKERPEDIKLLKEAKAENKPLNVSWEILYTDTRKNSDGTKDILDTTLRAVTVVGNPAYKGRTPILAVASLDSKAYLEEQEENKILESQTEILTSEDNKLDEQEYTQKVTELQTKLDEANAKIVELSPLAEEIVPLREFKASMDKIEQDNTKLAGIKEMFASAKVVKDEKYFADNKEKLLALDTGSLEFVLQEIVAGLVTEPKEEVAELKSEKKIPQLIADAPVKLTPKELAQALKDLKKN